MTDALEGINEKLKRAHETIVYLEAEAARFFKEGKHPIIGDEYPNLLMKKCEYNFNRKIPIRFSVLAGEVIHQFRSCFDHIAWQFASPTARQNTPLKIEFPIFHNRFKKDGSPSLKGKIEFIASDSAKQIIESVQPYNGADPLTDCLWIIHDLDRIYKHRELMLTTVMFNLGSPELNLIANLYGGNPSLRLTAELARYVQQNMRPSCGIAFREFCKGKSEPIIPALSNLENATRKIVGLFEGELLKC